MFDRRVKYTQFQTSSVIATMEIEVSDTVENMLDFVSEKTIKFIDFTNEKLNAEYEKSEKIDEQSSYALLLSRSVVRL